MVVLRAFVRFELLLTIAVMAVVAYEPAMVRWVARASPEIRLVNAAATHDLAAIDEALASGVDVDYHGAQGTTALMSASAVGDALVVRKLISAGADVNALDDVGETPLMYAARSDHAEVVHELLDHGADPTHVAGEAKITALEMATYSGADSAVTELRRY